MYFVRKNAMTYPDQMPFAEQARIFQEYAEYERDGFTVTTEVRNSMVSLSAVKKYQYPTPALEAYKTQGFEVRWIGR